MTVSHLDRELNIHEVFREKLIAEFPDADEDTLADTLEGLTDLHEMIEAVLRSAREDEATLKGLRHYIFTLVARSDRIQIRAIKKRKRSLDAMERADIKKITAPDFTASLSAGRASVVIVEVKDIPEGLMKERPPAQPDKRAISELLNAGEHVPGAVLSNPQRHLTIR